MDGDSGGPAASATARKPGGRHRRLTPEREAELYTAVLDLLREVGYDSLSMEAVAARTRCSKATLYRQWAGKPQLVAEALRHQKPATLDGIDTGSLPGDFTAALDGIDTPRMEQDVALLRGLIQATRTHPDLRQALRELLVVPELTGLAALLARAVERGEIRAGTPAVPYVPHSLLGLGVAHHLLEDTPADPALVRDYIDAVVLPALGV